MSPFKSRNFILSIVFFTGYISTYTFAAPVSNSKNPYDSFIEYLVNSNCSMPSVVKIPFSEPSDDASFSYLSNPLKECKSSDALKDSDEAKALCNEIFDALQNITCVEYKTPLPEIKSEPLSDDVCKDFAVKKIAFPKKNDYLSWRLVDPKICEILCGPGKYNLLCETLLWSHDLLTKIKSALKGYEQDTSLDKNDLNKIGSASIKVTLSGVADSLTQETNDNKVGAGNVPLLQDTNIASKVLSNINNSEVSSSNEKMKVVETADKREPSIINNQSGNVLKVISTTKTPIKKTEFNPNNEDLVSGKSTENLQNSLNDKKENEIKTGMQSPIKNDNNKPVNSNPETVSAKASNIEEGSEDVKKNVVENQKPLVGSKDVENNPLTGNDIDNSPPKVSVVTKNKDEKNKLEKNVEDKQKSKNNATKTNGADADTHSNEMIDNTIPQDTEMDNELNNVNLNGQENESKVKELNLNIKDDDGMKEKPKLTDIEPPLGFEIKSTESTTLELVPDIKEDEHQEEKDPDQYNDTENEGDYAKSEYESPFDQSLKNKVDIKSSDFENPGQISSNYDTLIRSRTNIDRLPVTLNFPEQEDSHFFFYFLFIVLVLMAGYLLFHNKQKIIALIVEGRHERRRRSHSSGYKKLETK